MQFIDFDILNKELLSVKPTIIGLINLKRVGGGIPFIDFDLIPNKLLDAKKQSDKIVKSGVIQAKRQNVIKKVKSDTSKNKVQKVQEKPKEESLNYPKVSYLEDMKKLKRTPKQIRTFDRVVREEILPKKKYNPDVSLIKHTIQENGHILASVSEIKQARFNLDATGVNAVQVITGACRTPVTLYRNGLIWAIKVGASEYVPLSKYLNNYLNGVFDIK